MSCDGWMEGWMDGGREGHPIAPVRMKMEVMKVAALATDLGK